MQKTPSPSEVLVPHTQSRPPQATQPGAPWALSALRALANQSRARLEQKSQSASARSPVWEFLRGFAGRIEQQITQFIQGTYQFSPMIHAYWVTENYLCWSFQDRLFLALLYRIIKPTFQAIIPHTCLHLKGPSQGVKQAIQRITRALGSGEFNYFMRLDIKGYYASIQHDILFNQIKDTFDDPRVIHYVDQIIHHTLYDAGNYRTPTQGIPMRSSLSPFLGALTLKPLDEAFSNRDNVFYVRYMDDIFILFKSKRQFLRAKKRIYSILRPLKLILSPNKSAMGKIEGKRLHFLGVTCQTERKVCDSHNPPLEAKPSLETTVSLSLHSRSIHRRAKRTQEAVDLGARLKTVQRSLWQSARWWQRVAQLSVRDYFLLWVGLTEHRWRSHQCSVLLPIIGFDCLQYIMRSSRPWRLALRGLRRHDVKASQ
jgi:hypothetical protein